MKFYLTSSQTRIDEKLTYLHGRANSFASEQEARQVAGDLLHLDTYSVWAKCSGRSPKLVAAVSL